MQSTRQEILDILRADGQATVDDLARRLELTPMTIRHHINVLQAQNLVVAANVRRRQKVGRPRLVYTLTEAADDLFPQSYGDLATHLVSEVKARMGVKETRAIFEGIAEKMAQEAPAPYPGQPFEERLEDVTDFLNRQGFLFSWQKTDDGYILANVNCPYRRVAAEHDEVCAMDTILLRRLLGTEPEHISRLSKGDPGCRCILAPPQEVETA